MLYCVEQTAYLLRENALFTTSVHAPCLDAHRLLLRWAMKPAPLAGRPILFLNPTQNSTKFFNLSISPLLSQAEATSDLSNPHSSKNSRKVYEDRDFSVLLAIFNICFCKDSKQSYCYHYILP